MSDEAIVAHLEGEDVREDVRAYAEARTADSAVQDPPEPECAPEALPEEAGQMALHDLVALNEHLDTVDPDADEEEDIVSRVKRLLTVTPGSPFIADPESVTAGFKGPEAPPIEEAEILLPLPVMADVLAGVMRNLGDDRYGRAPATRTCADAHWEFNCKEDRVEVQVTRGYTAVQEANVDLATIRTRIGEATRKAEQLQAVFKSLDRQMALVKAGSAPRVVTHGHEEVDGKLVPKTAVVPAPPVRVAVPDLPRRHIEARKSWKEAKSKADEMERRMAECRKIIEASVPQAFSFTVADIASGRVRVADSW